MKDWSCDIRCWWFYPNILWCRQDVSPGPRQEGIPGGWKETTGVWSQQQFSSLTHNLCRSLVCLSMILEIHYEHFALDDLSEFPFSYFLIRTKKSKWVGRPRGHGDFHRFYGWMLSWKENSSGNHKHITATRKEKQILSVDFSAGKGMRPLGCIKVKHFDAWDDFEFTPPFQSRNLQFELGKVATFPSFVGKFGVSVQSFCKSSKDWHTRHLKIIVFGKEKTYLLFLWKGSPS